MTFASRIQHRIYWSGLKSWIEWSLKTWLAPWAYIASVVYHDMFWYPFLGKRPLRKVLRSEWGQLFSNWEKVKPTAQGYDDVGEAPAGLVRGTFRLLTTALGILWTCIKEAPEFARKRRKVRAQS